MLQPPPPPPDDPRAVVEQIRQSVRERIEAAQKDAAEAAAAARAGADADPTATIVVRPREVIDQLPPQVVDISLMFFLTIFAIIVGFPIARAIARWIDRRSDQPRIPAGVSAQLAQISQSVEAMAIEIERISEGQRFTTKLLADQHSRQTMLTPGAESAAKR